MLVLVSLRSLRSWSANGQNSTLNRGGGSTGERMGVSRRAYWSRNAVKQARRTLFAVVMMSSMGVIGVAENALSYSGCLISYWTRSSCADSTVLHFSVRGQHMCLQGARHGLRSPSSNRTPNASLPASIIL